MTDNPLCKHDYVDLNNMPRIPDELIDFENYVKFKRPLYETNFRGMPVITSRGCPYKCTFCPNVILSNQDYRVLNAENTLNMVEYYVRKYEIDYLRFRDDNFFSAKDKVKIVLEGLINKELGIQWGGSCRVNYFREGYIDDKLLNIMVKSGCRRLYMGAESGSNKMLKKLKKGITAEMTLKAAEMCNSYEIEPYFSFMVGLPGETKEDLFATVNLMRKIKQVCPKANFLGKPAIFKPYPGGELYDECIKNGWLRESCAIEDWFASDLKGMYYVNKRIPWSSQASLTKAIQAYTGIAFMNDDLRKRWWLLRVPLLVLKAVASFRIRFNYYGLPIDKYIYEFLFWLRSFKNFVSTKFMRFKLLKKRTLG